MTIAVLPIGVGGVPAAADCPRYQADTAVRVDRMAEGYVGEVSALFASVDRVAQPAESCMELAYDSLLGMRGRFRRLESPTQTSRSLSIAADGLIDSDLTAGMTATQRRAATGARETELSQTIAVAGTEEQARWIRNKAADRLILSLSGREAVDEQSSLSIRNAAEIRRDRVGEQTAVSGVTTRLRFDVSEFGFVAGRSGPARLGWSDTWLAEVHLPDRGLDTGLRRGGVSIARNAGRTDRVAASTRWLLFGTVLDVDASSTRTRDWTLGLDWTLVDVVAGSVRLSADMTRTATASSRQVGLTGEFTW